MKLCHFYNDSLSMTGDFMGTDNPNEIAKQALILVEGTHVDSNKKTHRFSRDRVIRVAENTNAFIDDGGRVPWQVDHSKRQNDNIGDIEGKLELKVIEPEDVPDPRHARNLVGKLGVFATLVGKGARAVADIVSGNIKTLSPGIDISSDIIKEVSATPTPAIIGLSTFSQSGNFALTWDEAEMEGEEEGWMEEEYDRLCETFWDIANNIVQTPIEEFDDGVDPAAILEEAIIGFGNRLFELFGVGQEEDIPPEEMPPQQAVYSSLSPRVMAALELAEFRTAKQKQGDQKRAQKLRGKLRLKSYLRSAAEGAAIGIASESLLSGALTYRSARKAGLNKENAITTAKNIAKSRLRPHNLIKAGAAGAAYGVGTRAGIGVLLRHKARNFSDKTQGIVTFKKNRTARQKTGDLARALKLRGRKKSKGVSAKKITKGTALGVGAIGLTGAGIAYAKSPVARELVRVGLSAKDKYYQTNPHSPVMVRTGYDDRHGLIQRGKSAYLTARDIKKSRLESAKIAWKAMGRQLERGKRNNPSKEKF